MKIQILTGSCLGGVFIIFLKLLFSVKSPSGLLLLLYPLLPEFFKTKFFNSTVVEISKYFHLLAVQKNLQYMYRKRYFMYANSIACSLKNLFFNE